MEIDLNHTPSEVEKNAAAFISKDECDKLGRCNCLNSNRLSTCNSSSSSSNAVSGTTITSHCEAFKPSPPSSSSSSSIYMELWYACAGPLISVPKKGDAVVYFPQGHVEQAAASSPLSLFDMPSFELPPQIFCRVVDFQLLANKENDEVYTQLTLVPLPELVGVNLAGKESEITGLDEDVNGVVVSTKSTTHMFCKTLTASDTSTHGGFSVPRRAAEDCFPPLDYKEQRPSQELVAKDLHGVEWKFKHIYRGQPRRHLLTTGWSIFVSQKKLVSGDAVLFLREESGELRLGIRRAARPSNYLPSSIIKSQNPYPNVLSPVANALSSKTTFSIFYSPRSTHADFIVPYKNYIKCSTSQIAVGMRFRMRFDLHDSPDKRLSGVVTGVGDVDPYRWPNSKWRCLMVRWDDAMSNVQERVSPWDIDLSGNYVSLNAQYLPKPKKPRSSFHITPHNGSPVNGSAAFLDFKDSVKFTSSKVLQGQENLGLVSNLFRNDEINHMSKINHGNFARSQNRASEAFTGFLESNWFPKVLQGQEICSMKSLTRKTDVSLGDWSKTEHGFGVYNTHQRPFAPSFYPLASEGARNVSFLQKGVFGSGLSPSLLTNVSDFQTGSRLLTTPCSVLTPNMFNEPLNALEKTSTPTASVTNFKTMNDAKNTERRVLNIKISEFSSSEDPAMLHNPQGSGKRSCTKVHKQGSLVGRAIDLSRINGYDDLITELERLFNMEGLLSDPKHGWCILYADSDNDMMVAGDYPWKEFADHATKIHIYTQEEVEKLNAVGINSDDAKSCLEEARHGAADVCKSPSVGPSDSSHTDV